MDALPSRLTDAWLQTLIDAARVIGPHVDMVEVYDFVVACFELAEKPVPSNLAQLLNPESAEG